MGYDKEIEMIALARQLDLLTTPYVFDPDQAKAMVEAGADVLVAHVGLTTAGSIGAGWALTLDEAIERVMAIAAAGKAVRHGHAGHLPRRPVRRAGPGGHGPASACPASPASSAPPASSVCPPSARSRSRCRSSRGWRWGGRR